MFAKDKTELKKQLFQSEGSFQESLVDSIWSLIESSEQVLAGYERDRKALELIASSLDVDFENFLLPGENADAPDSINIKADYPLRLEHGFYPLEEYDDGSQFRWTGGRETASFAFRVDRSSKKKFVFKFFSETFGLDHSRAKYILDNDGLLRDLTVSEYGYEGVIEQAKYANVNLKIVLPGSYFDDESGRYLSLGFSNLQVINHE
jgi:hypothetical protein